MRPKGWQEIGKRLARMDRAELRDRIRQEIGRRQDGLLWYLGVDFCRGSHEPVSDEPGRFFFNSDSIAGILSLLRQRLPGQAERIVEQANKILDHRFDLLGFESLDYGSPIDWHLDAVHGKRAQRRLFYRIPYLDFEDVGDSKITWELNRHQHLVTLAKAFRLTGDHHYADETLRQWRHWQADNPYPVGINWASSLEAAFRSLSWIWTYNLLQGSPDVPDLKNEWLRGLTLHGRHLERYLSTYFSPNTHLLGEGVGLFFLGVLCRGLDAAERWRSLGWEIILREADRQVRADGFHFEQSTYYHVYALDLFLHSAILASLNGIAIPKSFEATLERMLTALCLLGRSGPPPRFGDDDGGRLFDPRRNRAEHLLDPLASGAILFHRGDYRAAVSELREETLWLLGAEGVRQWDELEATPCPVNSAALPQSGFYLLASQKPAAQLIVDAGPLGTQSGGHGHADALSVCLQSQGHCLLIDPGTYQYVGEDGERDLFRGTGIHNTLRVNGADQAEPATPFAWHRLTQAKAEQWIQGWSFDLLVASHDGYQRLLQPATHRRWILSLRNGIYLVRDVVEGQGKHKLDISWHLGQEMQLVEEGVYRMRDASQGLALLPAQGHGWAEEVGKAAWSPVYGQKAPMVVLNFGTLTDLPAEFTTLLVTLEEAHGKPGSFTQIGGQQADSSVSACRYESEDNEYSFFFGRSPKSWRLNQASSDAEFVCWSRRQGTADHRLILCNGTYAAIENGPELRFKKTILWGEALVRGEQRAVFSADGEAVEEEAVASNEQPNDTLRNL
jgi:hypothetical protein